MKAIYGMSKMCFLSLLRKFSTHCRLLKDKVLPMDNALLGSGEETKKMLRKIGVEYISYLSCLNGYILYRGELLDRDICP